MNPFWVLGRDLSWFIYKEIRVTLCKNQPKANLSCHTGNLGQRSNRAGPGVKINCPADDSKEYSIFRLLWERGKAQWGFCEASKGGQASWKQGWAQPYMWQQETQIRHLRLSGRYKWPLEGDQKGQSRTGKGLWAEVLLAVRVLQCQAFTFWFRRTGKPDQKWSKWEGGLVDFFFFFLRVWWERG